MLQDGPGPSTLSAADEFDRADDDIGGVAILKAKEWPVGSRMIQGGFVTPAGSIDPEPTKFTGDRLMDSLVQRDIRPSEGVRCGNRDGVSNFVVMPKRTPSCRATNQRTTNPARVSRDVGDRLKVAQAQGRLGPFVGSDDHYLGGARRDLQQSLIKGHIRRTVVRLVRQAAASDHGVTDPGPGPIFLIWSQAGTS